MTAPVEDVVERYLDLGLALGRHVDGLVDAYYGPPMRAARAAAGAPRPPEELASEAKRLLADLAVDDLDAHRRAWMVGQVQGLRTVALKLAGSPIGYLDEVEACYGVRPPRVDEEVFADAHRRLDAELPGSGPIADRYASWRESHAVEPAKLRGAIDDLAADLRERTHRMFGLPDGEHIDFDLVTDQPWSGFNYYLGDLRSRVAINTDLPVLSLTLAHLVAHEAYPGHHTEHTRKEAGLVRQRRHLEETIFLVGTPQCLLAEGLADLGLEIVMPGTTREELVAEHLRPMGIRYDTEIVRTAAEAAGDLGGVRGNAAIMLHEDGATAEEASAYLERWAMVPKARADKAIEFLTDPTWRAYTFCYSEGVALCRRWVGGDPIRFQRLITEQLLPRDLAA